MRKSLPVIISMLLLVSCFSGQPKHTAMDTTLYMSIGNPDTALAIFLYKECYHYDFDLQKEEYIRWYSEKDKLMNLHRNLFGQKPGYTARLTQLETNALAFLKDARNEVALNYKEYKAVTESMETDFLYQKRDTMLKRILNEAMADTAVDATERSGIKQLLETW